MAQKRIDLKIAIDNANAANSLKEIKQSFKELRDVQLQFGEGTKEFDIAGQKAGQLKDRIDAANDSIRNLSASPIENIRNSSSRLVQQIKSLDFGGATQSLRDLGSSGKALLGIEKGAKLGTIAFKGLKVAIAATGIGALVAILAVVIENFDNIKKSGGALGNIFNFIGETVEFVQNKLIDFLNYFKLVDGAALKAGIAQEKANKQAEESLNKLNLAYGLNADKYSESTQKKFQADLEYRDNVLKINKDETLSAQEKEKLIADAAAQRNRKILAVDEERRKANKEAEEKAAQEATEREKKRIQDSENQRKTLSELNIKLIQDQNAKELAQLDEKYKQDQFTFKNNKDVLKKLEEVYLFERENLLKNQLEKERKLEEEAALKRQTDIANKIQQTIDENTAADNLIIQNQQTQLGLQEQFKLSQQEIDDLYEQEANRRLEQNLSTESSLIFGSIQRNLSAKEQEKQKEEEINQLKVQGVLNGLQTISSLAELFAGKSRKSQERAFKVQKAVSIATALINTFQSATNAFNSLSPIPIVGPVLGGIAAAAAVASGLVQVNKIRQQKFNPEGGTASAPSGGGAPSPTPSLGGGGGGTPSLPSPTQTLPSPAAIAPQFFGTSGAFSGNRPQPVRAFVVESELTDAQLRAELLRRRTRL